MSEYMGLIQSIDMYLLLLLLATSLAKVQCANKVDKSKCGPLIDMLAMLNDRLFTARPKLVRFYIDSLPLKSYKTN